MQPQKLKTGGLYHIIYVLFYWPVLCSFGELFPCEAPGPSSFCLYNILNVAEFFMKRWKQRKELCMRPRERRCVCFRIYVSVGFSLALCDCGCITDFDILFGNFLWYSNDERHVSDTILLSCISPLHQMLWDQILWIAKMPWVSQLVILLLRNSWKWSNHYKITISLQAEKVEQGVKQINILWLRVSVFGSKGVISDYLWLC